MTDTISLILNAAIGLTTAALLIPLFRKNGAWSLKAAGPAFRFYTVLSNALCAAAALIVCVCRLAGGIPYPVRILKYIGAYAAELGGVDIIAFTGGVGENQYQTRKRVCRNLEYLGVKINEELNDTLWRGKEGEISTPDSKVKVVVVLTDEEYMIAHDTEAIVEGREP